MKKDIYYPLNVIEENEEIKLNVKEERKDAFIFIGKTGVGKTSLINLICGSNNKVGDSPLPETKQIFKEKGNYPKSKKEFYCLDTPGLDDKELSSKQIDEMIQDYLKKDEDIKIKAIFFLINFHDNKLDESFFNSLNTIINLFPMENFWEYIILCYTHSFVETFFSLEDAQKNKETSIKQEFEKIIEDYYKNKKLNKIKPETIKFLFINICSGKNYEKIKNNGNFKGIIEQNNYNKDKVINMIKIFEKKDPMFYSISEEKKNQLCYEKREKTYIIYEIDYVEIIFKDFTGKPIFSQISHKTMEEKYRFTDSFLYKHKRALGFTSGGILGGIFFTGLFIPGINVLEIGWLGCLATAVIVEGGTGYFVLKKGMKNTLEKIKKKEIKSIEEFEENEKK